MTHDEYYDWWFFSRVGLGGLYESDGHTYATIEPLLSKPGLTVVVMHHFLEVCNRAMDLRYWLSRLYSKYLPRDAERVPPYAVAALETIGARRSAAMLQKLRLRVHDQASSMTKEQRLALDQIESDRARRKINTDEAIRRAEEILFAQRDTPGVEMLDEVKRLLQDYIDKNHAALSGDVAKYGDPRQAVGFDREKAIEDRMARNGACRRALELDNRLPGLQELLASCRAKVGEEGTADRVTAARRRQLSAEYRNGIRAATEFGSAPLKAWFQEVAEFMGAHPGDFVPRATNNEKLNAELAAIGKYEIEKDGLHWESPADLSGQFVPIALSFTCLEGPPDDEKEAVVAYRRLVKAWKAFLARKDRSIQEVRDALVSNFHETYYPQMQPSERSEYLTNGELTEESIFQHIECATVDLTLEEGRVTTSIAFRIDWDPEHGAAWQVKKDGSIEAVY